MRRSTALPLALAAVVLAACGDHTQPAATSPTGLDARLDAASLPAPAQDRVRWFAQASPEVMALSEAVYATNDDATGQLVFAIDNPGAAGRVRAILARRGVPASAYRIVQSEPIRLMNTGLRTAHRPTRAGTQLQFGNYVCTLGFNVGHAAGRSFITNSHCTNTQGGTEGTQYYQPLTSESGVIAVEAADPLYARIAGCSRGKSCRYSDAARALYVDSVASSQGVIARTTGENTGSLVVDGEFTITAQSTSTSFALGTVMHKVGRTTGWSSGTVTGSCATVNVSGSNLQLLCQTLVEREGSVIVQGGDSGSPVFEITSGTNVRLAGILWGGSSAGNLFVFSPLAQVEQELGAVAAVAGATAPGDGGGDDPTTPCVPKGKGNNCK